LGADYWKPIQAGKEHPTDTEIVKSLVSNPACSFFSEKYLLTTPASPHIAAEIDKTKIVLEDIIPPESENTLIIEGAGGVYSPVNTGFLNADLIQKLNASAILVVRHYLGSINHSLLSIEALKIRKIPVLGIIFNGVNESSTSFILQYSGLNNLLQINEHEKFEPQLIKRYADLLKGKINE